MTTELYLIPNTTEASTPMQAFMDLSAHYKQVLPVLDGVLAESLAGGRKWLKMMGLRLPVIAVDHTKPDQLKHDLEKIAGQKWVFVTDAGYPCIADPGWGLVKMARSLGFNVHLLPGTSAIIAAIALSGLSSQRFAFNGYLPKEATALKEALKELELASAPKDGSWQGAALQVFIEVPHRYKTMLMACLEHLSDSTFLVVATEVANEGQNIQVRRVGEWKKIQMTASDLEPQVAVFLLLNEDKRMATEFKSSKTRQTKEGPTFGKTKTSSKKQTRNPFFR